MLKKFRVISKKFNLQCDVDAPNAQQAEAMAATWGIAFVLTRSNPLTVQEL
jgi:hypothetical protein